MRSALCLLLAALYVLTNNVSGEALTEKPVEVHERKRASDETGRSKKRAKDQSVQSTLSREFAMFDFEAIDAAQREAADRPRLSSGCADSSTNLVAGIACLAIVSVWFAIIQCIMSQEPSAEAAVEPRRLAVLDSCKFCLMIAVICQHTTFWFGPLTLHGAMQFVHLHTRTFCFISGLNAQGWPSERSIKNVVFRLIAPTILWTFVGFAYFDRAQLQHRSGQAQLTYLFQGFLTAPGISWYMYALVCWRVAGWALLSMKPPARVVTSTLIMAMSGYIIDAPGFVRNAGVYLPIFVTGQMFPLKEAIARIPALTPGMFVAGVSVLVATALWEFSSLGLAFLDDIPFYSWGSKAGPPDGYCSFGAFSTFWLRGLFRNVLEVSKGLVLLLFCLPRRECVLSRLGQYSLYTYLLHPWAQQFMNDGAMMRWWRPHLTVFNSVSFQLYCALGAVCYATIMNICLTSLPCRLVFRHILEPVWLEKLVCAADQDSPAMVGSKINQSPQRI